MYIFKDLNGYCATEKYFGEGRYERKFYSFTYCDHEMETLERRMCFSRSRCKKCGWEQVGNEHTKDVLQRTIVCVKLAI